MDRNRLAAGGLEGGDEVVETEVVAGESVVGRQHCLRVAAREVNRIGEGRGGVAEHVLSGDPEAAGHAGDGLVGETGNRQFERRRRTDDNPRLTADNTAVRGIGDCDRLGSRTPENRREGMDPGIGAGEGVIGRQHRLGGARAEFHGSGVTGRRITIRVLGSDCKVISRAGGNGRRISGNHEGAGGRGIDANPGLRAGDRVGDHVSSC